MELLNVSINSITSAGLDDITRIIEWTQLKKTGLWNCYNIFHHENVTRLFVSLLLQKKSSAQELTFIGSVLPVDIDGATYASIQSSLIRNQQLNRVVLLLVPRSPPQGQRQQMQPPA
jgi:hypothetical protein